MYSRTSFRLLPHIYRSQRILYAKCPMHHALHDSVTPRGIYGLANRRYLSTPPPQVNISNISNEDYHSYSDATMDKLLESLEEILDDLGSSGYEVEYHSGVLTLLLGDSGTYVVNKQPPNKQIWLSSPFSGPKRYDYSPDTDSWVYSRDGRALGDLLNDELSKAFGKKVDLGLQAISKQIG